jgi:hypothetical protein
MLDGSSCREPAVRQCEQPHARVSFNHRGPFKTDATYAAGDIAMLNGSAFCTLRDNPGRVPVRVGASWPRWESAVLRAIRAGRRPGFAIGMLIRGRSQ